MNKWVIILLCPLLLICSGCHSGLLDEKNANPASNGEEEPPIWDWQKEPAHTKTGVTLNVYNWGEYIDVDYLDVNKAFTHITGIDVNYKTFDSNEDMYALIRSGAADYDVVIPSDYMIGRMIQDGMLAKLNFDNIPNYQYIDDQYKHLNFDPNNEYSVPYTWGVVGIYYNKKYVDPEDLEQGWELLWDEKYSGKILMINNPRDAFGIAEMLLGYSLNTTDESKLYTCYEKLKEQRKVIQGYAMDRTFNRMINEEAYIAPYYNGDATIMMGEEGNDAIDFYIPKQGTNLFVDSACVLSTTWHQSEAEAYINFLCRPEVALANAEYIGYSSPHTEARSLLPENIKNDPVFYPPADILDNSEVYLSLPDETNRFMDELWLKLKR